VLPDSQGIFFLTTQKDKKMLTFDFVVEHGTKLVPAIP
jgi:hypothetical protein